jgi:hypothetical protein
MPLELNRDERQTLAELLSRRLDEIALEEHRTEAWHYKDLLRQEQVVLEGLRAKLEALDVEGEPVLRTAK